MNKILFKIEKSSTMRKLTLVLFFISNLLLSFSQVMSDKKIQAGLTSGIGLNFINPNSKYFSRNGVGSDLTIGMNFNYNYTNNLGLFSGLEFDFETLKYKTDSTLFYVYNDTEIFSKSQFENNKSLFNFTNGKVYQMTSRTQKPIYLTIPVMMLFRTDFIGYLKYFGKFGIRNSFLLANTTYDNGYSLVNNTLNPFNNDDMKTFKRDLAFYKGFIGTSGGVEWNFSGTTSLVIELGYYYGILNIGRGKALTGDYDKNYSLVSDLDNNIPKKFTTFSAKQNQLLLKLSILF